MVAGNNPCPPAVWTQATIEKRMRINEAKYESHDYDDRKRNIGMVNLSIVNKK